MEHLTFKATCTRTPPSWLITPKIGLLFCLIRKLVSTTLGTWLELICRYLAYSNLTAKAHTCETHPYPRTATIDPGCDRSYPALNPLLGSSPRPTITQLLRPSLHTGDTHTSPLHPRCAICGSRLHRYQSLLSGAVDVNADGAPASGLADGRCLAPSADTCYVLHTLGPGSRLGCGTGMERGGGNHGVYRYGLGGISGAFVIQLWPAEVAVRTTMP